MGYSKGGKKYHRFCSTASRKTRRFYLREITSMSLAGGVGGLNTRKGGNYMEGGGSLHLPMVRANV